MLLQTGADPDDRDCFALSFAYSYMYGYTYSLCVRG